MTALDPDFFSVSAQVIPLLLLVGLIDHAGTPEPPGPGAPRHRLGGPGRTLALARLTTMVFLLMGEVAALVAVAGRPTILERHFVVAGLAMGAFAVVDRFTDQEIERLVATTRLRARMALLVVFLALLIGPIAVSVFAALA